MPTESDANPSGSTGKAPAAALMLRIAGRQGPTFVLNPATDNTLGRAATAGIIVADRLASRFHAAVRYDTATSRWMLHDLGSRNGTWLDATRIETAVLTDNATVRIGNAELVFCIRSTGTLVPPSDDGMVMRCGPIAQLEGSVLRRSAAGSIDDTRRPLLLYQASIRLLASRSVREVIATTLELAAEHCGTKGVGWFLVLDGHALEPVCIVPPGSPLTRLFGESTRRLVAGEGQAVWLAGSGSSPPNGDGSDDHDLACVPIMDGARVRAALAASTTKGGLRAADFDFLVALASLAAAACAGHAAPPVVPMPGVGRAASAEPGDLASLQTVDLDLAASAPDDDTGERMIPGDDVDEIRIDLDGTGAPVGIASPESLRIESFVAEIPMLKLDRWQRMLVIEALRRTGGSVSGAAHELGISRSLLHRQLQRYGLASH